MLSKVCEKRNPPFPRDSDNSFLMQPLSAPLEFPARQFDLLCKKLL